MSRVRIGGSEVMVAEEMLDHVVCSCEQWLTDLSRTCKHANYKGFYLLIYLLTCQYSGLLTCDQIGTAQRPNPVQHSGSSVTRRHRPASCSCLQRAKIDQSVMNNGRSNGTGCPVSGNSLQHACDSDSSSNAIHQTYRHMRLSSSSRRVFIWQD